MFATQQNNFGSTRNHQSSHRERLGLPKNRFGANWHDNIVIYGTMNISVINRCCQLRSVRIILGATWSCQESLLLEAGKTETRTLCPPKSNENHFQGNLNNSYWPKLGGVAENPSGDLGTPRIIAVATWEYQNSCLEQFVSTKNHSWEQPGMLEHTNVHNWINCFDFRIK